MIDTASRPRPAYRSQQRLSGWRGRSWSGTAAARGRRRRRRPGSGRGSRRPGSGSVTAVTMTSRSALATTIRSVGSVSSAVRRSEVVRSSMVTMRARVSVPAAGVADDPHPVADDDPVLAQLAGAHRGDVDRPAVGALDPHRHPARGRRRPPARGRRRRAPAGCGCGGASRGGPAGRGRRPRRSGCRAGGRSGARPRRLARAGRPSARRSRAASCATAPGSPACTPSIGQPEDGGRVHHAVVGVGVEQRRRAAGRAR